MACRAPTARWLRRLPLAVVARFGCAGHHGGVRMLCAYPEGIERVRAALELLERVDPRRYRRVQRHLPDILVFFDDDADSHVMVATSVLSLSIAPGDGAATLAITLVGAATRLALHERGFRVASIPRWRLELACLREQTRFNEVYWRSQGDPSEAEVATWRHQQDIDAHLRVHDPRLREVSRQRAAAQRAALWAFPVAEARAALAAVLASLGLGQSWGSR